MKKKAAIFHNGRVWQRLYCRKSERMDLKVHFFAIRSAGCTQGCHFPGFTSGSCIPGSRPDEHHDPVGTCKQATLRQRQVAPVPQLHTRLVNLTQSWGTSVHPPSWHTQGTFPLFSTRRMYLASEHKGWSQGLRSCHLWQPQLYTKKLANMGQWMKQ